jgi:predicted enzyme related to lactoylglutathione lyase
VARRCLPIARAGPGGGKSPLSVCSHETTVTGSAGHSYRVSRATPDDESSVTFYIETDDLQAALDKINLLGGKTQTPISELPGMVTYARFADLDGLPIGLVLPPPAPGQVIAPSAGSGAAVDWFEVLGADAGRSQRFYAEVFGWKTAGTPSRYQMVDTGSPGPKSSAGRASTVPRPSMTTCRPERCVTRQATCSASTTTPLTTQHCTRRHSTEAGQH